MQLLGRVVRRSVDWLDRHAVTAFVAFSVLFFASAAAAAHAKPFWHDEIGTLIRARLPSIHDVVFNAGAFDYTPPLEAILTRFVDRILGEGHVVSRLPSLLGFWFGSLFLFALLRRLTNTSLAIAGCCLLCFTAAYRYSYEARPYGLVLGFAALAWYAWSNAANGHRRLTSLIVLSIALAGGVWAHYWAILVYLPILVGELVRTIERRVFDRGVIAAVGLSVVAILPLIPVVHEIRQRSGASSWTQTINDNVGQTYGILLDGLTDPLMIWLGVAAVAIAVGVRFAASPRRPSAPPVHELAAATCFVILPVVGVWLGHLAGNPIVARYVLASICGVVVLIPTLIWYISAQNRALSVITGVLLIGFFAQSAVEAVGPRRPIFHDPVLERPLLTAALKDSEPVVVTGGLVFLQLWYYAPPDLRRNLTYVADPTSAAQSRGGDTVESGLLELAKIVPINVIRFTDFISRNEQFIVYQLGAGPVFDDLKKTGAVIEERGNERGATILHVRR